MEGNVKEPAEQLEERLRPHVLNFTPGILRTFYSELELAESSSRDKECAQELEFHVPVGHISGILDT